MQVVRSVGRHLAHNAVGYLALLVATSGTAYAAATIDSADVVDNSLKSADIRNDGARGGGLTAADLRPGSVGSSEVVDGSLTAADLADSAAGAADEVAEWSVGYTGGSETVVSVTSSDTFARGILVQALDGRLTGDFSSCTGFFELTVSLSGGGGVRPLIEFGGDAGATEVRPSHVDPAGDVTETGRGLVAAARCVALDPEPGTYTEVPVPAFDLSVTFQWTDQKATATTATFQ